MILRTERLVLREFEETDWLPVLGYQSDPRYLRYYTGSGRTEAEARSFVQMFLDWQQEQPRRRFQLAILVAEEGRLIGNCGIRMGGAGARQAELGYELDPAYWGRGYASEAARALLAFGFRDLTLHKVSARVVADNAASVRVLERLGFQREGHLRENEFFKGRWWDTLLYGLLDREWQALSTN